MDRIAKLAFVKDQLSRYSGTKTELNDESTFIRCPYHSEKTGSFRIFHSATSRSPGFGKCYGCGAAHPWNEFAPLIGLLGWEAAKPAEVFAAPLNLQTKVEDAPETLEFSDLPPNKVWRSIPTNFLITIGARKCVTEWGEHMVWLPVMVRSRLRGYVKARLRKDPDKISYVNSKGPWSKHSGLFLYDYVAKQEPNTVVLVEGPRDGLRLNYLGIPTISILGTQSWSSQKTRYLELLGVKRIIMCMDGDCAGRAAVEKIVPLLSGFAFDILDFDLTGKDSPYHRFANEEEPTKAAKAAGVELWDPMNMPMKKVNQLRKLVNEPL